MKKYYNVYEFENDFLVSNIFENGKMTINPEHNPRTTAYDEMDESKQDFNSYLAELNRRVDYIKLHFEEQKKYEERYKNNIIFEDDTSCNLIDDISYFTDRMSSDEYEGENQRFLIYEDDNYMIFSYVGKPEYYELEDDNWLIISKKFDKFYFINPKDDVLDDEYVAYNLVTIYERDENKFTKKQIKTNDLNFYIDYNYNYNNINIDNFIKQKVNKLINN